MISATSQALRGRILHSGVFFRAAVAAGVLLMSTPHASYAALGDCAQPVTGGAAPAASDCLFLLRVAVGLETCDPACACAPAGTLPTKASDALLCLRAATGQPVALACPCGETGDATIVLGDFTLTYRQSDVVVATAIHDELIFTGELRNDGEVDLAQVVATAVPLDDSVLVATDDEFEFSSVGAGQAVVAGDELRIVVERGAPFDPSHIAWTLSGYSPATLGAETRIVDGDALALDDIAEETMLVSAAPGADPPSTGEILVGPGQDDILFSRRVAAVAEGAEPGTFALQTEYAPLAEAFETLTIMVDAALGDREAAAVAFGSAPMRAAVDAQIAVSPTLAFDFPPYEVQGVAGPFSAELQLDGEMRQRLRLLLDINDTSVRRFHLEIVGDTSTDHGNEFAVSQPIAGARIDLPIPLPIPIGPPFPVPLVIGAVPVVLPMQVKLGHAAIAQADAEAELGVRSTTVAATRLRAGFDCVDLENPLEDCEPIGEAEVSYTPSPPEVFVGLEGTVRATLRQSLFLDVFSTGIPFIGVGGPSIAARPFVEYEGSLSLESDLEVCAHQELVAGLGASAGLDLSFLLNLAIPDAELVLPIEERALLFERDDCLLAPEAFDKLVAPVFGGVPVRFDVEGNDPAGAFLAEQLDGTTELRFEVVTPPAFGMLLASPASGHDWEYAAPADFSGEDTIVFRLVSILRVDGAEVLRRESEPATVTLQALASDAQLYRGLFNAEGSLVDSTLERSCTWRITWEGDATLAIEEPPGEAIRRTAILEGNVSAPEGEVFPAGDCPEFSAPFRFVFPMADAGLPFLKGIFTTVDLADLVPVFDGQLEVTFEIDTSDLASVLFFRLSSPDNPNARGSASDSFDLVDIGIGSATGATHGAAPVQRIVAAAR